MGKIFHEGERTQDQDYRHSWTPSSTNQQTGLYEGACQTHKACSPLYDGKKATPSWYAFDVEDIDMAETQLANHAVNTLSNLSATAVAARAAGRNPQPFFLAVGFHKPHVPWYAPSRYWDYYPEDNITLAPHRFKPVGAPNIAMQDVMRAWAHPKDKSKPLSCRYTDLCAQLWPGGPDVNKSGAGGTLTPDFPFDNTTYPDWKAKELRRAYWAAVSYTDANIGLVLDALHASPFANSTIVALWGDHGYALGDNDEWAKQTNFEHATHIPFMISVPGLAPGVSHALVEEVDLLPTLVQASTLGSGSQRATVPPCPADTQTSRATSLCTEGFSLLPLLRNSSAVWGRGAWSQFVRKASQCDCPAGSKAATCNCNVTAGNIPGSTGTIMGYTLRVDAYRYTVWVFFNQTAAAPDFTQVVGEELYLHDEHPLPVTWGVEHTNVIRDPQHQAVAERLRKAVVQCGQRPDTCPVEVLAGLVP